MTALAVINIRRSLDKNHAISERDARILLAYLDAQEKKIAELEAEKASRESAIKHMDAKIAQLQGGAS